MLAAGLFLEPVEAFLKAPKSATTTFTRTAIFLGEFLSPFCSFISFDICSRMDSWTGGDWKGNNVANTSILASMYEVEGDTGWRKVDLRFKIAAVEYRYNGSNSREPIIGC